MACFLGPAAGAVVAAAVKKGVEHSEAKQENKVSNKVKFSVKLSWLIKLFVGGVVLLAFEHVWHGEVVPYFPFLTAMNDPADKAEMLHELVTVGTSMTAMILAVWVVMCLVADSLLKRDAKVTA